MRVFLKILITLPSMYFWLLLVLPSREGSATPADAGYLTLNSKQDIIKTVKEINELNITMNSTAFLDAMGGRIEELLKKHMPSAKDEVQKKDSEKRCNGTSPGNKYQIIHLSYSWYDAIAYCKEKKMNLATILNEEDNKAMVKAIVDAGITSGSIWVGGTSLHSARGWYWMTDGSSFEYNNWLSGQPDNFFGIQKCLSYLYGWNGDIRWAWDDNTCSGGLRFACQTC